MRVAKVAIVAIAYYMVDAEEIALYAPNVVVDGAVLEMLGNGPRLDTKSKIRENGKQLLHGTVLAALAHIPITS